MATFFSRIFLSVWLFGLLLLAGGFVLGFAGFSLTLPRAQQLPFAARAQAIVVFTGSRTRIPTALALWRRANAPRLLVSGVHRRTASRDLVGADESDNIALGRAARNTFENAVETVLWANDKDIVKIILVTSDLHMRRSLLYLRCLAPHLEVVPFATPFPRNGRRRAKIKEYAKYLLALAHCPVVSLPKDFPVPQALTKTTPNRA